MWRSPGDEHRHQDSAHASKRCEVEAIMTTFRSSTAVTAHGGMPASSTCGGSASSPRRLRTRSVVIPPWVITATGPGRPGRSARNACNRAPACRDESPSGGTKSRSCVVRAYSPRKASKGRRRPSSGVHAAWRRAGPQARWQMPPIRLSPVRAASGWCTRHAPPWARSHRPVRVACCRPISVSPGPRQALFLAVLHQVGQCHADDPARPTSPTASRPGTGRLHRARQGSPSHRPACWPLRR